MADGDGGSTAGGGGGGGGGALPHSQRGPNLLLGGGGGGGPSPGLGVLLTGYVEKSWRGSYRKRFLVLTHTALHWFKRTQGYDLFGEERGQTIMPEILRVAVADGDPLAIELSTKDGTTRIFRTSSTQACGEWVAAIKSAMSNYTAPSLHRRQTLSGINAMRGGAGSEAQDGKQRDPREATVMLVSVRRDGGEEVVLARKVPWKRVVYIPPLKDYDTVVITMSNGAIATLDAYGIEENRDLAPFLCSLGDSALSSAVEMRVITLNRDDQPGGGNAERQQKQPPDGGGAAEAAAAAAGGGAQQQQQIPHVHHHPIDHNHNHNHDTSAAAAGSGPTSTVPFANGDRDGGAATDGSAQEQPQQPQTTTSNSTDPSTGARAAFSVASAKASSYQQITRALRWLTGERDAAVGFTLAGLCAVAIATSFFEVGSGDIRFALVVALLLAMHTIYVLGLHFYKETAKSKEDAEEATASTTCALMLVGFKLVTPDQQLGKKEEIPKRYINGCFGDMREARRRWDLTKRWRQEEKVDTILEEEQPYFEVIKRHYPHYFCGRGKNGNCVYVERLGKVEMPKLREAGVSVDNLLRHYVFMTEYLWKRLDTREDGRTISILDIEGVGVTDLMGEPLEFLKRATKVVQEHYVERAGVIFIVNAPSIFSYLWKMVKPHVNEVTQKKIRIVKHADILEELQQHIDIDDIPVEYGGQLTYGTGLDGNRFHHPDEAEFAAFVRKLNKSIQERRRREAGVLDDDEDDADAYHGEDGGGGGKVEDDDDAESDISAAASGGRHADTNGHPHSLKSGRGATSPNGTAHSQLGLQSNGHHHRMSSGEAPHHVSHSSMSSTGSSSLHHRRRGSDDSYSEASTPRSSRR